MSRAVTFANDSGFWRDPADIADEARPPMPLALKRGDNAGPAAMAPSIRRKGTDGIADWIRRYFIVSNFARRQFDRELTGDKPSVVCNG
jgi:hypothetical protein